MDQIKLEFSATVNLFDPSVLLAYGFNEGQLVDDTPPTPESQDVVVSAKQNDVAQPQGADYAPQDTNLGAPSTFATADPLLPALQPGPEASTASVKTEVGNAEVELTGKARKRKGYEASAGYEELRAHQHHVASQKRLARSIGGNSLEVAADNAYVLLPKAYSGASGSGGDALKYEIDLLRINATFRLATLKTFRAIPYRPRSVVHVYGRDKALVALRTFRHWKMDAAYMADLMRCVDKLATSCCVKEGHTRHNRGQFAQMLIGWNHGTGEKANMPYRFTDYKRHQKYIEEFLESDSVKLAIQVGNELFLKYFPKTAEFCQEINTFWKEKTKGEVKMEFGHFYTMAINFPMAHEVKAIPHVDGKNIAFCPCAISPIGFFPSGVQAWFVNHNLRLIFQVPTAVWTYTLSSLIIHYNADTQEFMAGGAPVQLVTTADYEWPTATNATPLTSIGTGRGSIVLYNQASFAHWLVTGERYMKNAEAVHGVDGLYELFTRKAQDVLQYPV